MLRAFPVRFVVLVVAIATIFNFPVRAQEVAQEVVQETGHHESLNAVLWVQTSVEYRAATMGIYALATIKMDEALTRPEWSAALEQIGTKGYSALPPAVILDVDETVLDNSRYQARLIQDGMNFSSSTWLPWMLEEAATAVPGSIEFTRYAAAKGVQIIYLTNRDASAEEATRRNLLALGFPVDPDMDTILTRGERHEWSMSDKTSRREYVAERYRILLLIGDNYGDFSAESRGTLEERDASVENYAAFWGHKWILVPNPLYGSWESALIENKFSAPMAEKLSIKRALLQTHR